ncbi:MAG: NfeD family protein [Clostridiales bacterium]|nr:NfeD family protein [Clostridiales bacterium]
MYDLDQAEARDASQEEYPEDKADRLIGREGIVIVPLNKDECKGQVKVDGQVWSAKSDTDIAEGIKVTVKAIEGVKLVVEIA